MTQPSLRLDVEAWTQQLKEVWKPTRILDVRNQGTLGLLFIARVPSGSTLYLRVQWTGLDTCALWQGGHYVLWDGANGFLSTPQPWPIPEEGQMELEMRALIRRNCFLMGSEVGATEEEKRQWLEEFQASSGSEPPQSPAQAQEE